MVENLNFEKLACPDKVARDPNVRFRGGWIAAGMIMHEHNRRSSPRNCRCEDLTTVYEKAIQRALGNVLNANQPSPGVQ